MNTEIEKMYENVGILKECLSPCYINKTWRKTHDCPNCDNRENYPPFTAEKQIEILKLILKKRRILDVAYIIEQEKYHCMHYECAFNSFEEALCADINYHWKDLTEEERKQVKEY